MGNGITPSSPKLLNHFIRGRLLSVWSECDLHKFRRWQVNVKVDGSWHTVFLLTDSLALLLLLSIIMRLLTR